MSLMKSMLLVLLLAASNSYAGNILKWVDKNGYVHYGDNPPPAVSTQPINVLRPPSNPGKPLPRLGNSHPDNNTPGQTRAGNKPNKPVKTAPSAEQKAKACTIARNNLDVLNRSDIVRLRLSDGSERILSDKEIDQRRTRYQQEIKQYCQ